MFRVIFVRSPLFPFFYPFTFSWFLLFLYSPLLNFVRLFFSFPFLPSLLSSIDRSALVILVLSSTLPLFYSSPLFFTLFFLGTHGLSSAYLCSLYSTLPSLVTFFFGGGGGVVVTIRITTITPHPLAITK